MKSVWMFVLGACLASVAVYAQEKNDSFQEKTDSKNAAAQAETTSGQNEPVDKEYKIGPQDVLRIDVWREDQLTQTVPVRPDRNISLPLLNDVQAPGLKP